MLRERIILGMGNARNNVYINTELSGATFNFSGSTGIYELDLSGLKGQKINYFSVGGCKDLLSLNVSNLVFGTLPNFKTYGQTFGGGLLELNLNNITFSYMGGENNNSWSLFPETVKEVNFNNATYNGYSLYKAFFQCQQTIINMEKWNTPYLTETMYMFLYANTLKEINGIGDLNTSQVTNMYSMFRECYNLTSLDLTNWDISNVQTMGMMFYGCSNLKEIKMGGKPGPLNGLSWYDNYYDEDVYLEGVEDMFRGVYPNGTFYYNSTYNYSKIINQLPSGWRAIPLCNNIGCIDLIINDNSVSGKRASTLLNYTATLTGNSIGDGSVITWSETGNGWSNEFGQNPSTTTDRNVTVSFTYYGKTATKTIIQRPNRIYNVILNNQWQLSTSITNPDSNIYEGVYESFSNKGVDYSAAIAYIDIECCETFNFYVRSYAEGSYDFVVVSNLDCTLTSGTTSGSNVKMTTKSNQKSGTTISDYTLVEFTGIDGGEHRISVMYRKDSSSASGTDQGYLLIPKNQ